MGTGKWYVGPPVSILAIYYIPLYMLVSATLLALCIRPPSGEKVQALAGVSTRRGIPACA